MALKPYTTHTDPPLTITPPHKDDDDQFVVTLVGSSIKELYRGNLARATSEFNKWVDHYEERRKAEA